jgi:hypothetical protein
MQENGSQRALKIERFYHKAFDRFIYRKRWMSLLGLVLGMIYSAWLLLSSDGALQLSTGELSQPHFAWSKTGCEKCHLPNVPIRKDAWGGDRIEHIRDNNKNCNSECHAVTGHFEANTKTAVLETESCSTCHREHLGFDRSLLEVYDSECSRCHADIASVTNNAVATNSNARLPVSNFSIESGHPKFASLEKPDPGTIHFSHAQHMRPGQPKSPNGAEAKKLDMIPEKFRRLYQDRVDANQLIQLTCSDCHARDVELKGYEGLELADAKTTASVQSTDHMLFKPVEFEKHCAACHDLDGLAHGLDRKQMDEAIKELTPLKILEYLKKRFTETELDLLEEGKVSREMKEEIDGRKARLDAILSQRGNSCAKCHEPSTDPNSIVAPSNLKRKWMRDASFTHGAHLMVSCKDCHAEAYRVSSEVYDNAIAGNIKSKEESRIVMIAGITKCRECHIQDAQLRSQKFATLKHVATADCVDCHRYHSDPPKNLKVVGLADTAAMNLGDVQRFLASEKIP